jgi:Bacterial SH3 domain
MGFTENMMTGLISNLARGALCAVALTAVSASFANAAPATVGTNTNLRQGPGTGFGVIMTVPGGSVVEVIRCGGEWCNVMADGRPGYMIARNLGLGGPAPVAVVRPPVVVVAPGPYYGYGPYYGPRYYGPGFYYGPRRYWRRW